MNRFVAFARIGLLGFAAAAIPLSTGCGLDVEVGGSTGTGSHTGSGGGCSNVAVGVGGAGVGGGPSMVAVGVGAGGSPGVGGSSTSGSVGSGPGPVYCGGNTPFPTPPCAADEYCDYGPDNCGSWDNQGICTKRPVGACPPVFIPTCGCDGQIHGSSCDANADGTDVNVNGCMPPVGQFPCGATFCDSKTQYCIRTQSDVLDETPTFVCKYIPATCGGTASCACLSGEPCGDVCKDISNGGGHEVTCYEGG